MLALWLVLAQLPPAPTLAEPPANGWRALDADLRVTSVFPSDAGRLVSVEYEVRPDDGGTWGQANVVASGPQTDIRWPPGLNGVPAVHLERWCFRARWSNEVGPSSWTGDRCFRFDLVAPTDPVGLTPIVDGGRVEFPFTPSTDATSGIDGYWGLWYAPVGQGYGSSFNHGFTTTSPVVMYLGLGTWDVAVNGRDLAANYVGTAQVRVDIVPTSISVPTPPPPAFLTRVTPTPGNALMWSSGPPYVTFRYRYTELDGGVSPWIPWDTYSVNTTSRTFVPTRARPLVIQRASITPAGDVSAWSADSVVGGWDDQDPRPPNLMVFGANDALSASWSGATDEWSGVAMHSVQLEVNDGGFVSELMHDGGSVQLSGLDAGTYRLRVRAIDFAGRVSPWVTSGAVALSPFDAGTPDAGTPDAGSPDAGLDAGGADAGLEIDAGIIDADDAGAPGRTRLSVGCACDAATVRPIFVIFAFLALARRRVKAARG